MGALEKVGMLKMDMLGLKTLTVIHDAVATIRARTALAPTWTRWSWTTPRLRAASSGRTAGVFQFESPLATDSCGDEVRPLR